MSIRKVFWGNDDIFNKIKLGSINHEFWDLHSKHKKYIYEAIINFKYRRKKGL